MRLVDIAVKKAFRLLGLQVSRLQPPKNSVLEEGKRFRWLRDYNIRTILDIGANEGQFAERILTVFPDASLHSFEPLASAFLKLKDNVGHRSNVTIYNFGLGEKEEDRVIFKNEFSPSSSLLPMLDLHKVNFDYAVEVEPELISLKRLDSVFANPLPEPLLVKIDVQGYEMFVIKGGEAVLGRADVVVIETSFYPLYEGQPLFEDIYSYFTSRGFQYRGNVDQLLAPTNHAILQSDAVFVKTRATSTDP